MRGYRFVAGLGGVFNVYLMMIANLVGFAVGVDGMKTMLAGIFTKNGVTFLVGSFVCIYSTVQVMFEVREAEQRASAGSKINY